MVSGMNSARTEPGGFNIGRFRFTLRSLFIGVLLAGLLLTGSVMYLDRMGRQQSAAKFLAANHCETGNLAIEELDLSYAGDEKNSVLLLTMPKGKANQQNGFLQRLVRRERVVWIEQRFECGCFKRTAGKHELARKRCVRMQSGSSLERRRAV